MKKKLLVTGICVALSAMLLAGCGGTGGNTAETTAAETTAAETTVEETTAAEAQAEEGASAAEEKVAEELSEEILALSTLALEDNEFTLPVSFKEFSKATGLTFDNATEAKFGKDEKLPPYATISLGFDYGGGALNILIANQQEEYIKAEDGNIIGIKVAVYSKAGTAKDYTYSGLGWENGYQDIKDALGDPANEETNAGYYMLGYTQKRDETTNVSYSFIVDEDKTYSFAVSIDDMQTPYTSLESLVELAENLTGALNGASGN